MPATVTARAVTRARRRNLAVVVGVSLCVWTQLACGGSAARASPGAPRRPDEAAQLAGQLPRWVSRCVVARPSRVSAERRSLVQQVAQAGPLAWLGALDVRAYASALRVHADGTRSEVVLLRASDPLARVREVLSAQPYLDVVWEGEARSCEDADCAERVAHAALLADGTVRIRVGRGTNSLDAGSDVPRIASPCEWLAARARDAIEVSATASELPGVVRELRVTRVERTRVVAEETLLTDGPLSTQRVLEVLELGGFAAGGAPAGGAWRTVSRVVHADGLVSRLEAGFDELALRRGDELRLSAALRYEHALARPLSATQVDLGDGEAVLYQADLHLERLGALRGDERLEAARALAALLTAAREVLPDDGAIALRLARLRLDELRDGDGAASVAAEMSTRESRRVREWRLVEREARALAGSPELGSLLVRDGVASPRESARVAADIIAAHRRGVAYPWSEGAAVAGQRLDALTASATTREVPAVSLPFAGLPAGLLALAELGAPRGPEARAVYLLVRGVSPVEGGDVIASSPSAARMQPVRIHAARAGEAQLFAGRSDDGTEPLVALGRALALSIGESGTPLTLTFALVPWGAPELVPVVLLVLDGQVDAGALVVTRVSRDGAALDWDVVRRTLIAPLASIEGRFPAPEVSVELRSEDEAQRVAARVVDARCQVQSARVVCSASTAQELGDAVTSMAAPLLGTTPRALWGVASFHGRVHTVEPRR